MTSSTLLLPIPLDDAAEATNEATCEVCPHARADHDAIGARFCSATGNGAIARGCVCRA